MCPGVITPPIPPPFSTVLNVFTSTLLYLLPVSMGYYVTTKPGQSKYAAGPSSILKTKFLTGEQKWTFACAMFRVRNINGERACALPTERPANCHLCLPGADCSKGD